MKKIYETDLSDSQWKLIKHFIPPAKKGGCPRKTNMRKTTNAILYILRSGCQWRNLPKCFPKWRTVYEYFIAWSKNGVLDKIHDTLREQCRTLRNKKNSQRQQSLTRKQQRQLK